MKFPSLHNLQEKATKTINRFPLAILAGFLVAFSGIYLVELQNIDYNHPATHQFFRIILSSLFVFPLFVGIKLMSEVYKWENRVTVLSNLLVVCLGLFYYFFLLPESVNIDWYEKDTARTVVISICAFLAAITFPLIKEKDSLGFWQYLRIIIERFVLTFFYSLILFLGIALIIFTLNSLFSLDIPDTAYPDSWLFIAGILSPTIFLSEIPADLKKLATKKDFSKIFKTLCQYILIPLVTIYALILYVYGAKILLTSNWPEGIVSGLIIGFALVGIVTLLILDPYKKLKENAWLEKYTLTFYTSLLPLSIMLFMAIGIRIQEYGFTESRYYVVLLGIWLVLTALYFLLSRKKDIRFVPVSIITFLFLSIFGPWSAFSVSENSQVSRLENILLQNNLLVEGKLAEKPVYTDTKDGAKVSSILYYLGSAHGYDKILPWISDLDQDFEKSDIWDKREIITKKFNVGIYNYDTENSNYYYFSSEEKNYVDVRGYDVLVMPYLYDENGNHWNYETNTFNFAGSNYTFSLVDKTKIALISGQTAIFSLDLKENIETLISKYSSNSYQPELKILFENNKVKAFFNLSSLEVFMEEGTEPKINSLSGKILLKFK